MKGYKQLVVVGILILAVAVASGFIGYSMGKARFKAWQPERRHIAQRIAKQMHGGFPEGLSREKLLREEQLERLGDVLAHRRAKIQQRLARLKEEDPDKYREVIQRQINKLEATLERLKKELPESTK